MATVIQQGATVLFQGDSITDAGRNRQVAGALGNGYALMAAARFSMLHPERGVNFLNRGISGNRVKDLVTRWKVDCLALKPDWVSIMIGVNDTWRRYDRNDPTSTESYADDYRRILTEARDGLQARFILIEPFVLPHPEDRRAWREDIEPRIEVVHRLAQEFDAILVPMDRIMNEQAKRVPPGFWAGDGVHPKPAGHMLIAQAWLDAVGA